MKVAIVGVVVMLASSAVADPVRELSVKTPSGTVLVEYKSTTVATAVVTVMQRELTLIVRGAWRISDSVQLDGDAATTWQQPVVPELERMLAALRERSADEPTR